MTSADYNCKNNHIKVTENMKKDFELYGYVMVRNLLDKEELVQVQKVLEESDEMAKHGYQIQDGNGQANRMVLWCHPGNDVTGMVARCEKMATTSEQLLGGEVYHYHSKMIVKDAFAGGKFEWHQDYGYWYNNGCLFPDMLTVFIAIDSCTKENGCLQVLRGSHRCGRIQHDFVGGQTGADLERVKAIKESGCCPLEFVEMEPGDALFFHSNLLHTSSQNNSPNRRLIMSVAYNKRSNDPVVKHHCPCYTPLEKVPNSAIKQCKNFTDMSGKEFLDPSTDKTVIMKEK